MNEKDPIHTEVIFKHDRTCCVCRKPENKHIQIHHIDGNHNNSDQDNLAVLCLDCHAETQIQGGFFRKLTPELVKKYRDEWVSIVSKRKKGLIGDYKNQDRIRINIKSPVELFLSQFYDKKVLPLNTSFYFIDYYIEQSCFPAIVATSSNLEYENISHYRRVLKAYLFCILGEISPPDILFTDSYEPSQSIKSIKITHDIDIAVPNWKLKSLEGFNYLQITALSSIEHKVMDFSFSPLIVKTKNRDYSSFNNEVENILKVLVGKVFEL